MQTLIRGTDVYGLEFGSEFGSVCSAFMRLKRRLFLPGLNNRKAILPHGFLQRIDSFVSVFTAARVAVPTDQGDGFGCGAGLNLDVVDDMDHAARISHICGDGLFNLVTLCLTCPELSESSFPFLSESATYSIAPE